MRLLIHGKTAVSEVARVLKDPEIRKTGAFLFFNFLGGLGYTCGFFSSNSLLVSRFGTSVLFSVYFLGAIVALGLSGIVYFLVDRLSRLLLFATSFSLMGVGLFISWYFLRMDLQEVWIYAAVRAFCFAIYVLYSMEFWLFASDSFTNFEAKRWFPLISAAEIIGMLAGGFLIDRGAISFGTVNFLLVWSAILIGSPILLWKYLAESSKHVSDQVHFFPVTEETTTMILTQGAKPVSASRLAAMLFVFWLVYSFLCYGVDFVFNSVARELLPQEDQLTAYFGRVAMFGSVVVLFYQVFFARLFSLKFGLDWTLALIAFVVFLSVLLVIGYPNLRNVGIAEGIVYFVVDFASVSLLGPVFNVFPRRKRGRFKMITEGFGRPGGTALLFLISGVGFFHISITIVQQIVFIVSLLFLIYPILFQSVYLKHLLSCLHADDASVVSNAIQALGEKNKKAAVKPLRTLLKHTHRIDMKKTIVLTLGRISSREAFQDIVNLFSVRKESLQTAVLESLSYYKNYEAMLALFRLMKSKHNVSFQVRLNATAFLTKLVGKLMVPFLMDSLDDPDPRVRANAVESIGILKDPKSIPILIPFLKETHHRIQANAVVALYRFYSSRAEVKKILERLYVSDVPEAQRAALYAIGELRLHHYEKDLLDLLQSSDKKLIILAAAALGQMKNPFISELFVQLLLDEDAGLAKEAARQLGKLPRLTRVRIFEKMAHLTKTQQRFILRMLQTTPYDFSYEHDLMDRRKMFPGQMRL